MIVDMIDSLLGTCPPGMEFLRYIFAFVIALVGVGVVAYIARLPLSIISDRFKQ